MSKLGRMSRLAKITGALCLLSALVTGCSTDPKPEAAAPGAGASDEAKPSASGLKPQQLGKPFAFQETFTNTSDVVDWTVTVDKVKCGLTAFEDVEQKAPDGQVFCRLDASITNGSDERALSPDEFGKLETDKGDFKPDKAITNALMIAEEVSSIGFDPGETAKLITVWQVPAGAEPVAVRYPAVIWNNGPEYRITVG
jgi:hypothetical protein